MTFEELKQITKQREKRTIEYKEAWSELPGNLFETVCAFLNRDGGVIVLGAHDDTPHPKNPHMANFFVQIGLAEHLGTGIRNLYKYVPTYTGKQPEIEDEDMYIVRTALPIVMPITRRDNSSAVSGQKSTPKWPEKAQQIIDEIAHNASVSIQQLDIRLQIGHTTIKNYCARCKQKASSVGSDRIKAVIGRYFPNRYISQK